MAKKRTFLPSKNVISPGETSCLMILWFSSRKNDFACGAPRSHAHKKLPFQLSERHYSQNLELHSRFCRACAVPGPRACELLDCWRYVSFGDAPLAVSIWGGAFASPYGIGLQGLSAYEPSATACQKWQAVPACWRNAGCKPSAIARSKPKRIADCSAYGTLLVAALELDAGIMFRTWPRAAQKRKTNVPKRPNNV